MTLQTVAIQVPQSLYHRLERFSQLTHRPLEKVIVQTLETGIPTLPDDLSEVMRKALIELESLSDEALWQVARSSVSLGQQRQHSGLLEKNQLGTLTESERERLAQLRQAADTLMLRKAYAYVLLKWRGYRLPTLDELEMQA